MVVKAHILTNLSQIGQFFRKSKDPHESYFLSKVAILELCGWIEVSMDDVIESHAKRRLRLSKNIKMVSDDIVKRNFGFDYDQHFRSMVIKLVGIQSCEKIESSLDPSIHAKFVAELTTLKTSRNSLAHTYTPHTGRGRPLIDAPSRTIARVPIIYDGLKAFEAALRAL